MKCPLRLVVFALASRECNDRLLFLGVMKTNTVVSFDRRQCIGF